MWWTYALLSAFFAGLTAILAKVGMKDLNSDLALAIRTLVIAFIAWMIVLVKGQTLTFSNITWKNWLFLVTSGITTGCSWIFYFKALQMGKVTQVAAVDKLSVAFAIGLAIVFLGDPLQMKELAGALFILIGTLLLL